MGVRMAPVMPDRRGEILAPWHDDGVTAPGEGAYGAHRRCQGAHTIRCVDVLSGRTAPVRLAPAVRGPSAGAMCGQCTEAIGAQMAASSEGHSRLRRIGAATAGG